MRTDEKVSACIWEDGFNVGRYQTARAIDDYAKDQLCLLCSKKDCSYCKRVKKIRNWIKKQFGVK